MKNIARGEKKNVRFSTNTVRLENHLNYVKHTQNNVRLERYDLGPQAHHARKLTTRPKEGSFSSLFY